MIRRNLLIDRGPATQRLLSLRDTVREAAESQAARSSRFHRIAGRAENGSAPVAVSSWQLFPTPAHVAERMMDAAALEPGQRILEPSVGTGNLVRAMLARGARAADVTACEVSADVAHEFAADFAGVRLIVGDFLAQSVAELGGPFDRIVMNPPFHRGEDARHILHAASMLAPGGVLVGLCYDGRAFREELRDVCWSSERLPSGSFREAGTRADVVLVVMKAGDVLA